MLTSLILSFNCISCRWLCKVACGEDVQCKLSLIVKDWKCKQTFSEGLIAHWCTSSERQQWCCDACVKFSLRKKNGIWFIDIFGAKPDQIFKWKCSPFLGLLFYAGATCKQGRESTLGGGRERLCQMHVWQGQHFTLASPSETLLSLKMSYFQFREDSILPEVVHCVLQQLQFQRVTGHSSSTAPPTYIKCASGVRVQGLQGFYELFNSGGFLPDEGKSRTASSSSLGAISESQHSAGRHKLFIFITLWKVCGGFQIPVSTSPSLQDQPSHPQCQYKMTEFYFFVIFCACQLIEMSFVEVATAGINNLLKNTFFSHWVNVSPSAYTDMPVLAQASSTAPSDWYLLKTTYLK